MYSGTSTTSSPPTVIMPPTPQAQLYDSGTIEIEVDLSKGNNILVVEGKTVTIEKADSSQITYKIKE